MAINKLNKVYIFIPEEDREALLNKLQKEDILHIETNLRQEIEEETGEKEVLSQEIDLKISRAEYIIAQLKKYEKALSLKEQLDKASEKISFEEFEDKALKFPLEEFYREIHDLVQKEKGLKVEEAELLSVAERLEPFEDLAVDFAHIKNTHHVHMRIGFVSEKVYDSLVREVGDVTDLAEISRVNEDFENNDYIFIVNHKKFDDEIDKLLTKYGFHPEEFDFTGTVTAELKRIKNRIDEIDNEKDKITETLVSQTEKLDEARIAYDYLINQRARHNAENYIYETRTTALLKGWIRKKDADKVEKIIAGVTDVYEMITQEPDEDDNVPVEMKNPKVITPMEFVIELYGTPKYDEYDPTIHVFPFFILFFAVCLTDAGYGLLLLLLSLGLAKVFGQTKLIKVLIYGALVTILVGIGASGFFGVRYEQLPAFMQNYNLNEHTKEFLTFTILLGIFQMTYGFMVGAKLKWDRGDRNDAIESILLGFFFGLGAPVVVMQAFLNTSIPDPWGALMVKGALGAGALFILFKFVTAFMEAKFEGTAVQKAIKFVVTLLKAIVADSAMGLFKAISDFLSNMLSYARLMALGLATGSIGLVVNMLAKMVHGIPVVGIVLFVLVMVGGHLANLILSSLGAFVHTARLQYVEFFPYFFEGGGKRFQPFAIRTRYNKLSS